GAIGWVYCVASKIIGSSGCHDDKRRITPSANPPDALLRATGRLGRRGHVVRLGIGRAQRHGDGLCRREFLPAAKASYNSTCLSKCFSSPQAATGAQLQLPYPRSRGNYFRPLLPWTAGSPFPSWPA